MNIEDIIGEMHDDILVRLSLDWDLGVLKLQLQRMGEPDCTWFEVPELVALVVERRMPWGHGFYVNGASLEKGAGGTTKLTIEMQSGDLIVAEFVARDGECSSQR